MATLKSFERACLTTALTKNISSIMPDKSGNFYINKADLFDESVEELQRKHEEEVKSKLAYLKQELHTLNSSVIKSNGDPFDDTQKYIVPEGELIIPFVRELGPRKVPRKPVFRSVEEQHEPIAEPVSQHVSSQDEPEAEDEKISASFFLQQLKVRQLQIKQLEAEKQALSQDQTQEKERLETASYLLHKWRTISLNLKIDNDQKSKQIEQQQEEIRELKRQLVQGKKLCKEMYQELVSALSKPAESTKSDPVKKVSKIPKAIPN